MKQHLMITLLAIASSLMFGEVLVGQLPGGPPNKVQELRGNGRGDGQIQSQIQQQIQVQVQSQVQAQVNARMQADVNRAADLAQRAASTAQRQATAAKRIAGSAEIKLSENASAQGALKSERGITEANSHAQASARLRLPPGFAEADVELYDRIFGKHNPIRAQQPRSDKERGAENGQGADNGMKVRAVNYEEKGTELAAQIHLAIQQRRAEISELRDRALQETNPELLEQADQMELVMDTFVEAQARAKARADAEVKAESEKLLDGRGKSNWGPNGEKSKSTDQSQSEEVSFDSRTETSDSNRGKRK